MRCRVCVSAYVHVCVCVCVCVCACVCAGEVAVDFGMCVQVNIEQIAKDGHTKSNDTHSLNNPFCYFCHF